MAPVSGQASDVEDEECSYVRYADTASPSTQTTSEPQRSQAGWRACVPASARPLRASAVAPVTAEWRRGSVRRRSLRRLAEGAERRADAARGADLDRLALRHVA